jgi:hypothetical protein
MAPRYKHKCPSCKKLLFTRDMYCRLCVSEYPQRASIKLYDGQQKWLKGLKLVGVPAVEPKIVVEVFGHKICLDCGVILDSETRHKCYSKSRASGYTGTTIVCAACTSRKPLHNFPIFIRRIRSNSRDQVRAHICSECLHGKPLVQRIGA